MELHPIPRSSSARELQTVRSDTTEDIVALRAISAVEGQTHTLDSMPEEILDNIVFFLSCHADDTDARTTAQYLYPISVTSLKLNRITNTYLYTSVVVTLCKNREFINLDMEVAGDYGLDCNTGYSIPSTEGCNAIAFLRTLKERPDLAVHVKALRIEREDYGFGSRWLSGHYGWSEDSPFKPSRRAWKIFQRLDIQTLSKLKPSRMWYTMDPESTLTRAILRRLPAMTNLDTTKYWTDSPFSPFHAKRLRVPTAPLLDNPSVANYTLVNLTTVAAHCYRNLPSTWAWFTLPHLEHLTLFYGALYDWTAVDATNWNQADAPRLKTLEISHFSFARSSSTRFRKFFDAVFGASPALKSVKIGYLLTTPSRTNCGFTDHFFRFVVGKHSERLDKLEIGPWRNEGVCREVGCCGRIFGRIVPDDDDDHRPVAGSLEIGSWGG